jgi:hypothetical protein
VWLLHAHPSDPSTLIACWWQAGLAYLLVCLVKLLHLLQQQIHALLHLLNLLAPWLAACTFAAAATGQRLLQLLLQLLRLGGRLLARLLQLLQRTLVTAAAS